jgi:ATP-dependent DNA helicase RecG
MDIEKLKSIGCQNLLDLSLLAPTSYEDNTLYDRPNLNIDNVIDVKVINSNFNGKVLQIDFFSKNFNMNIKGIIFSPMPYHSALFKRGEELYIRGRIEVNNYNQQLQIVQPKKITTINTIDVKYKHSKSRTIKSLLKKYLTVESLLKEGIFKDIAQSIYDIHFPTFEFLSSYNINNCFFW